MAGSGRLVPFDHPFFSRQRSWAPGWDSDHMLSDMFKDMSTPSRIFDQHFGVGMWDDELFPPTPFRGWYLRPRRRDLEASTPLSTPVAASGISEVSSTDKEFKINLDVSHFKPEELSVKTVENKVIVHAKHEERPDEHGYIQREFKRMYLLPKEVDPVNVKSSLSADGILTVTAPKPAIEGSKERTVPIEQVPASQN